MPRSVKRILCGGLLAAGGTLRPPLLSAQALSGRVVDGATHRPLAGVAVVLLRALSDDTAARAAANVPGDTPTRGDTTALATAVTSPDGVFLLTAPAPGTYRARIGAGFVTPPVTLADAESFETREYQLAAPPPAPLAAAAPAGAPAGGPTAPSRPPSCSEEAVLAAIADGSARAAPEDSVTGLRALRAGPAVPGAGPTLCAFQVERQAAMVPGTLWARYPDELRRADHPPTRGRVVAQFVVDEHGDADMATFKILEASDPAFIAPVREGVSRARFSPAEIGRHHKVRQLVQLPFTFTLATGPRRGGP